MKKCPRCGHEMNDDEKFCPHCGLDLEGRYKPIRQKNKSMTYLIYVIIFFSFITISTFYGRILQNIGQGTNQPLTGKQHELADYQDVQATSIVAGFDTLADFNKAYSNVDGIVQSITKYEKDVLEKDGQVFDKNYEIVVLNNNNISFRLTYTTKLNDQVNFTIVREYDRAHTINHEVMTFRKTGVRTFEDLFFHEDELKTVYSYTNNQEAVDKVIQEFSNRKDEFEEKKKKLGHYGLGSYDDNASFVVYRRGENFDSEIKSSQSPKEYIS